MNSVSNIQRAIQRGLRNLLSGSGVYREITEHKSSLCHEHQLGLPSPIPLEMISFRGYSFLGDSKVPQVSSDAFLSVLRTCLTLIPSEEVNEFYVRRIEVKYDAKDESKKRVYFEFGTNLGIYICGFDASTPEGKVSMDKLDSVFDLLIMVYAPVVDYRTYGYSEGLGLERNLMAAVAA